MEYAKKGFTLIELLIVIGILAVLATITVLVLNPAQLFAQARDSQRISDLGSIRSAVSLYLTTVSSPDLALTGLNCVDETTPNFWASVAGASSSFTGATTQHANTGRATDGTGWVPVNLGSTSGGSPLSALPTDPSNDVTVGTALFYTYTCNQAMKTFEVNANMESSRYSSGDDNVENSDGGDVDTVYEVGTDPGLDL